MLLLLLCYAKSEAAAAVWPLLITAGLASGASCFGTRLKCVRSATQPLHSETIGEAGWLEADLLDLCAPRPKNQLKRINKPTIGWLNFRFSLARSDVCAAKHSEKQSVELSILPPSVGVQSSFSQRPVVYLAAAPLDGKLPPDDGHFLLLLL